MDTNKIKNMSRTLLLMSLISFLLSFYYVFTGELKIGNSTGLKDTFEVLTFAENPLEYSIIIGFVIAIGILLLVFRSFILKKFKE